MRMGHVISVLWILYERAASILLTISIWKGEGVEPQDGMKLYRVPLTAVALAFELRNALIGGSIRKVKCVLY